MCGPAHYHSRNTFSILVCVTEAMIFKQTNNSTYAQTATHTNRWGAAFASGNGKRSHLGSGVSRIAPHNPYLLFKESPAVPAEPNLCLPAAPLSGRLQHHGAEVTMTPSHVLLKMEFARYWNFMQHGGMAKQSILSVLNISCFHEMISQTSAL